MDNKKIEEMTRDYQLCYPCEMFTGYVDDDGNLCGEKHCIEDLDCTKCGASTGLAKALIKSGYRKIPDGAIVLTEDCYKALVQVYEDWRERCTGVVYEARKETAREILAMFSDRNIVTWDDLKSEIERRYIAEVE